MCCLKYENDEYETAKEQLPDIGSTIKTSDGSGRCGGVEYFGKNYSSGTVISPNKF